MNTCEYCGIEFESKRPARFCCPAHRAAWHKEHAGIIPATVQSTSMTAEGAMVVVVRVPKEFHGKIGALLPRTPIDLLQRDSAPKEQK